MTVNEEKPQWINCIQAAHSLFLFGLSIAGIVVSADHVHQMKDSDCNKALVCWLGLESGLLLVLLVVSYFDVFLETNFTHNMRSCVGSSLIVGILLLIIVAHDGGCDPDLKEFCVLFLILFGSSLALVLLSVCVGACCFPRQ